MIETFRKLRQTLLLGGVAVAILAVVPACKGEPGGTREIPPPASSNPASPPAPVQTAQPAVTPVDPGLVCMMNNQFMGKPQIPVMVEGRTYFGCCEMCKTRLANDASTRTAIDPVTQKPVDKAMATIGKTSSGAVVYFENEANLRAYAARP